MTPRQSWVPGDPIYGRPRHDGDQVARRVFDVIRDWSEACELDQCPLCCPAKYMGTTTDAMVVKFREMSP